MASTQTLCTTNTDCLAPRVCNNSRFCVLQPPVNSSVNATLNEWIIVLGTFALILVLIAVYAIGVKLIERWYRLNSNSLATSEAMSVIDGRLPSNHRQIEIHVL